MRRDPKAFDEYNKKKRLEKILTIMKREGVSNETIEDLLEIMMKDNLVKTKLPDIKELRLLIDFAKVKALTKGIDNALNIDIDTLRGFTEK